MLLLDPFSSLSLSLPLKSFQNMNLNNMTKKVLFKSTLIVIAHSHKLHHCIKKAFKFTVHRLDISDWHSPELEVTS